MAALELTALCKSFPGGMEAVVDVDLQVQEGEFLVLVGPSGCGKSTLLRMVAGLESPTRGEIRMNGQKVHHLEPKERDVAMVFQNYALYPHMTVAGNIAFPLKMARNSRKKIRAAVQEAAELLGIAELLERKPAALSGGQQQRVALARALVRRPRLFLFDEPLSNVDAKLRAEMRAELAKLHRETRATMLYVTHDQVEAMTLGSRIAVLHRGRLQQVGAPTEVYHQPANMFVASFLGAPPMNFLSDQAAAALGPKSYRQGVILGFRPHDAMLGGDCRMKVHFREDLGHESLFHGVFEGHEVILALPGQTKLPSDGELAFHLPADRVHAFDPDSGIRLP
ncbi:MAG: sn-glycerol-3-phosphate ABC transporter ATP-binding protein UgpC [Planctomycetota bacterium]|nr:MAG: sn-glycerol-3-phosphate ABC transporter ATP-binding protein UgpC [Planctomycetota bacterium]